MKRIVIILFVLIIWAASIGAERNEPLQNDGHIDFEAAGFQKMATTAYHMGHHTANGSAVHSGGCAMNHAHLGQIAIIYTTNGNFLGYYEVNDVGGTEGLKAGRVIDVYRCNLTQCESYMKITQGQVWVKFVEGDG
jgi:hypothetical protein